MFAKKFGENRLLGAGLGLLLGAVALCFLNVSCTSKTVNKEQSPPPVHQESLEKISSANGEKIEVVYQSPFAKPKTGKALTYFVTANFTGSGRCAACHDLLTDSAGNDVSIVNYWRSTMMANGARDPLWQAKVGSEVNRNPALKKIIEEKCITCHMPMARTQAVVQGKDVVMKGFLDPAAELNAAAMDGISCTLCHQVQDSKLGGKESFSGKYVINTAEKGAGRKVFGPYEDAETKTMRTSVGFTPVYASQMNDSSLCAVCHTLYTPFIDGEGHVAGEFPEQTPYLEWQHSEFSLGNERRYDIGENPGKGLSCQACHMPHSAGGVKIARWAPKDVGMKDHFSKHSFVGGNVLMLNMLQDNAAELNLTASTSHLEDTKNRTITQLQSDTAEVSFAKIIKNGAQLVAEVVVENKTGHKFPTGIPIRGAWLHFTVADGNGEIVFESGRPKADGSINGNDNDENNGIFEPHYQVITAPDQVQIYEAVMQDTDAKVTYTLLRAASYVKDNRLLPWGFDKNTATADIAVYGTARADDDFSGGSDLVTYQVDIGDHAGPFTVTAELLYRSMQPAFMADLEQDRALPEVGRFLKYYDKVYKNPVPVAAVESVVR